MDSTMLGSKVQLYTERTAYRGKANSPLLAASNTNFVVGKSLYTADLRFSTFNVDALFSIFAIVDELAEDDKVQEDLQDSQKRSDGEEET
jgi:hypothetical protein